MQEFTVCVCSKYNGSPFPSLKRQLTFLGVRLKADMGPGVLRAKGSHLGPTPPACLSVPTMWGCHTWAETLRTRAAPSCLLQSGRWGHKGSQNLDLGNRPGQR